MQKSGNLEGNTTKKETSVEQQHKKSSQKVQEARQVRLCVCVQKVHTHYCSCTHTHRSSCTHTPGCSCRHTHTHEVAHSHTHSAINKFHCLWGAATSAPAAACLIPYPDYSCCGSHLLRRCEVLATSCRSCRCCCILLLLQKFPSCRRRQRRIRKL